MGEDPNLFINTTQTNNDDLPASNASNFNDASDANIDAADMESIRNTLNIEENSFNS